MKKFSTFLTKHLGILFFKNHFSRAVAINTQEGNKFNSPFINLNVMESNAAKEIEPKIIVGPDDMEIVRGTAQASLDCIANANPLHELETLW